MSELSKVRIIETDCVYIYIFIIFINLYQEIIKNLSKKLIKVSIYPTQQEMDSTTEKFIMKKYKSFYKSFTKKWWKIYYKKYIQPVICINTIILLNLVFTLELIFYF